MAKGKAMPPSWDEISLILAQVWDYIQTAVAEIAAKVPGGQPSQAQLVQIVTDALNNARGPLFEAMKLDLLKLALTLKGPVRHDPVDLA